MKHRVRISATVVVEAETVDGAERIASERSTGMDRNVEYLGLVEEQVMSPRSVRHVTKATMRGC